jgi:hypothetical protein
MTAVAKTGIAAMAAALWAMTVLPRSTAHAQLPPPEGCGVYSGNVCSLQFRCTIYDPQGNCQSWEITQYYYE